MFDVNELEELAFETISAPALVSCMVARSLHRFVVLSSGCSNANSKFGIDLSPSFCNRDRPIRDLEFEQCALKTSQDRPSLICHPHSSPGARILSIRGVLLSHLGH